MRRSIKWLGAFLAIVVAGVGLWLAAHRYAPRATPEGQPPLATLNPSTLGGFKQAFNAAEKQTRILVLLSPT